MWGDTLCIDYHPGFTDSLATNIYFLAAIRFEDSHSAQYIIKSGPCKNHFTGKLIIPDSSSFIKLFITDNTVKVVDSTFKFLIYNKKGNVARNGYANLAIFYNDDKRLALFKKELNLYPDNYAEYQNYWSALERVHLLDAFSLKDTVSKSLKQIAKSHPPVSADLLYLSAHAYLILKKHDQYTAYLHELTKRYPISPITSKYLSLFKIFEEHTSGAQNQIPKQNQSHETGFSPALFTEIYSDWQKKILQDYPISKQAFSIAQTRVNDQSIAPASLKYIFLQQIKKDPKNPKPYFFLAKLYLERLHDLQQSFTYLNRAANTYKVCNKPFYFSVYSTRYQDEFFQNLQHLKTYVKEMLKKEKQ